MDEEYITARELAKSVGIHQVTMWKRLERGDLPARKYNGVWMIKKSDAQRYIQAYDILDELRERAQAQLNAQ